ncbi:Flp family type IVb pilin [Occallatibacter savannae]|uniref:Flp family type IVb pilin n=1 Tax=Occallatibacter savannae TaxID=1002691 RepID=UPI000D69EF24|nr:hypothetical protein [Occallatibacter savannae]
MNALVRKLHLVARSVLESEGGQSITEYAMAFSLIALGTVAGQSAVAQSVNHTFVAIASSLTTSVGL